LLIVIALLVALMALMVMLHIATIFIADAYRQRRETQAQIQAMRAVQLSPEWSHQHCRMAR
jgi:type II secretory pathway component PulK